jgi:hypothetical protein
MDLPVFGNPTLALDLMEVAGVADDDETRTAEAERFDARRPSARRAKRTPGRRGSARRFPRKTWPGSRPA